MSAGEKQQLLEQFFSDMDRSLREMGVGDMSIGKKVRAMAEAAFGRLAAYEHAGDSVALKEALRRNVYGGQAQEQDSEPFEHFPNRFSLLFIGVHF